MRFIFFSVVLKFPEFKFVCCDNRTMPINQQLSFAEGFRTLTDKLKEKLRDLQDSKKASGEDLVVNERDMKDIVGELVLESITTGSSSV